ncbi:hypothetical protein D3C75_1271990 [compost metagenome]
MAIDPGHGFAQGFVEGLIKLVMFACRHRHAHDALKQPRVLRQLGVVNLGDFVIAVVQVEQTDHQQAGQHQADDQGQGAPPDRSHEPCSTR